MNNRILTEKLLLTGLKSVFVPEIKEEEERKKFEEELEARITYLFEFLPRKSITFDQLYSCYCTNCKEIFDTPENIGKLKRCKDCNFKYRLAYNAKRKGIIETTEGYREMEVDRRARGRPKKEE